MNRKHLGLTLAVALVASTGAKCGGGYERVLDPCRGDVCITGTMHYFTIEGGFWAIRGDDSVTYDPISRLDDAFRKEGLRVRLDARERRDMSSIHAAGPLVEIIALKPIE
ncbi:MAG TPA: hypothetical protein VJ867_03525 [Gemmatimonadaceae bacterium]|nr:hypothetical protein [Gemmatimonadaceae bacterium]